jgi:hypothetical protein
MNCHFASSFKSFGVAVASVAFKCACNDHIDWIKTLQFRLVIELKNLGLIAE